MAIVPRKPVEVFYSYAPKDEALRDALEKQLGNLKRQGVITDWHDRKLIPGTERRIRVDKHLNAASIILLLISPDFIASDYCYSSEMIRAMERHNAGEARVIPIILRPTDWEGTPFDKLQVLPSDGKPITSWRNRDKALLDIAKGIRQVIEDICSADGQDTALDLSSQQYCSALYERWKMLDFKGIMHVDMNRPMSIPLLEVFVLPDVLIGVPEYETLERPEKYEAFDPKALEQDRRIEDRRSGLAYQRRFQTQEKQTHLQKEELQTMLARHRRLVILGDPGSGKSTLLRYMMLSLAQESDAFSSAFPRIANESLALPLYIPLASYADAWSHYIPGERSLQHFLPNYLRDNYLHAYSDTLSKQLARGKVLVLFDGLDEIPDTSLRMQIVQQVEMFSQSYPGNRFIVTSRIVGYKEAPLSAGYQAYTLADFDEEQIKTFTQRWCPAYERWVKGTTDDHYLQNLATKEAEKIFQAIQLKPAVKKLAANPLILTILALIQRQGIELPAHRIELFDLCVVTLLDTWVKAKGVMTTTHFTKGNLIKILRPLAFWMHEHPAIGAIPEEELTKQVVRQLLDRKITRYEDEATKLAEEFLYKVRGETGLLVERGRMRYGFLHLTFEEYFAASELELRDDRKDFIKAHLHDPRWREVILLTIGAVGILRHNEKGVTELVQDAILNAGSQFEHWLHRDLLFAGICLADDIGVSVEFEDEIVERTLSLYLTSPYDSLRDAISNTLTLWRSSRLATKVIKTIMPLLQKNNAIIDPITRVSKVLSITDTMSLKRELTLYYQNLIQQYQESEIRLLRLRIIISIEDQINKNEWIAYVIGSSFNPDWQVRQAAVEAFGQLGSNQPEVIERLFTLLSDPLWEGNQEVAEALGQLGSDQPEIIERLLTLLSKPDWRMKEAGAKALGLMGNKQPKVIKRLIGFLSDYDSGVRSVATEALGQLGSDQPKIIERLLKLLADEDSDVRQAAVEALGQLGRNQQEIVRRLSDLLTDEDSGVRQAAVEALGQLGSKEPEVIAELLNLLADTDFEARPAVLRILGQSGSRQSNIINMLPGFLLDTKWQLREAAAEALGQLGDGQPEVIEGLLDLLSDPFPGVRQATVHALGQLGSEQPEIIEGLLDLLSDSNWQITLEAATALGQLSCKRAEIIEMLLGLLSNPLPDVRQATIHALGDLTNGQTKVIERLVDLLSDDNDDVWRAATKVLRQLGNKQNEIIQYLIAVLSETSNTNLSSNVKYLKKLDDHRKVLNNVLTVRLLELVKSVGKGQNPLADTLLEFFTDADTSVRQAAAEALGQLGYEHRETVEKLLELLSDSNGQVRRAAVQAIGKLGQGQPELADSLLKCLFDYQIDVKQAAVEALRLFDNGHIHIINTLLRSLVDPYRSIQQAYHQLSQSTIETLQQLGNERPEIVEMLLNILSNSSADYQLQQAAAKALGQLGKGQPEITTRLLNLLFASDSLRDQAPIIEALGQLGKGQSEITQTLLNFLSDPSGYSGLEQIAAEALGQLGDGQPEVIGKLLDLLSNSDSTIKQITAEALGRLGDGQPEVIGRLLDLLSDSGWQVRQKAAEALGHLGDGQPEIIGKLLNLLSDSDFDVRQAAAVALGKQGKGQAQVIDALLKFITSLSKDTFRTAISYALASSQVDRVSIGQQIEELLQEQKPISSISSTADYNTDLIFFALQQVVGEIT